MTKKAGRGRGGQGAGDAPKQVGRGRGAVHQQQAPRPGGQAQQAQPPQQQQQAFPPLGQQQQQAFPPLGQQQQQAPRPQPARPPPAQQQPPQQQQPPAPRPSQPEQGDTALVSRVQTLTLGHKSFRNTKRPGYGKLGRPIELISNHYEVQLPSGKVYHYDVEVYGEGKKKEEAAPDYKKHRCLSTIKNRQVIDLLYKTHKAELANCLPAFDGRKNLYVRRKLPRDHYELTVPVADLDKQRTETFTVRIKFAREVDLDTLHAVYRNETKEFPQEAIQAMDIVLRHGPCLAFTPVGRSFFRQPSQPNSLDGGCEVWYGFYTSVRPGQWKPMLVLDMSATAFYKPMPVVDFIADILRMRPNELRALNPGQIKAVNDQLRDIRVEVTHLPYKRKYKVKKLGNTPADKVSFKQDDGSSITVAQYFATKYKLRLNYAFLPCIEVGSTAKTNYLPIEVCRIAPNQHHRKKLSPNQTRDMIRCTARPPADRFRTITDSMRDLKESATPYMKEFGLSISTDPVRVTGRVLQPPQIVYADQKIERPSRGEWKLDGGQRFFKGGVLKNWCCICLSGLFREGGGNNPVNNLCQMLVQTGHEMGMTTEPPKRIGYYNLRNVRMEGIYENVLQSVPGCGLILIVLGRDSDYSVIKHLAETKYTLRTQCVNDMTVSKRLNRMLVINLLQKINTKVGGINNSLLPQEKPPILGRPVIIIGADVTHPAPGDKMSPSIAAVVGSMDAIPSRYYTSLRVQRGQDGESKARIEIIVDLRAMIKEQLIEFRRRTNHKPHNIVFYRDGVSEGQFEEVRDKELVEIRAACTELENGYQPAITFIVVQKRHHTRFRPADQRDGVGKCQNIPPGTTVDHTVTHPVDFDFFLCSHTGIQGTSKPAHYYIVWDDAEVSADDLQKLSFYLCHTYARCARSVSIPAPVYYAHLAAFRAKEYIKCQVSRSSTGSESSGGIGDSAVEEYAKVIKVIDRLKDQMFFV